MHVVFYDGECGLCDHIVQFLLKIDKKGIFSFAPLQGKTAKEKDIPQEEDSLVLIENYGTDKEKISLLGKGAFRICWLLGGFWSLLGWISFLPGFLYNWGYRLVARNRHRLFPTVCALPKEEYKKRFLP